RCVTRTRKFEPGFGRPQPPARSAWSELERWRMRNYGGAGRHDMGLQEDRDLWHRERRVADQNRVAAAEIFPGLKSERLRAVLEADAAVKGIKLDLGAQARRGAVSPLGGTLGGGWGPGRPTVAAHLRRA